MPNLIENTVHDIDNNRAAVILNENGRRELGCTKYIIFEDGDRIRMRFRSDKMDGPECIDIARRGDDAQAFYSHLRNPERALEQLDEYIHSYAPDFDFP